MNSGILYDYLDNNSFDKENLVVNYSFEQIQNGTVFNEIYTSSDHFPEAGCLNASIYPGILVSCLNHTGFESFKTCCSMAYFDGDTVMRMGYKFNNSSWTAFINYNNNTEKVRDKAEVLLSSMEGPDSLSGFNLGINGSNRLYVEYINSNGVLKNVVLPREMELYNLISVSKNKSQLSISNHDPFSRNNYYVDYYTNDFVDSDVWTIGGFYDTGNHERYKGFVGWMDDFILFDSYYSNNERDTISQALYFTGMTPAYEKEVTQMVNTISGAPTIITKESSFAVTGYEMEPLNDVSTVCETPVTVCKRIALTGAGTIEVLEFPRVDVEQTLIEIVPEERLYNELYTSKYAEKNIVFLKDIDNKDIYEIQSLSGFDSNLNKPTTFDGAMQSFFIDDADIGKNLDIFINGAYQLPITGYTEDSFTINTGTAYGFDDLDTMIYDISDSGAAHYYYDGDNYPTLLVTGDQYLNKDVYFRGQKLLSGEAYSEAPHPDYSWITGIEINVIDAGYENGIAGTYSFLDRSSEFETTYTGSIEAFDRLNFDLRNEKVWLNGYRQVEDIDYIKTSQNSLINNDLRLEKKTYLIYNNSENYFNVTV